MPLNKTYRQVLDASPEQVELILEIPSFAGGENTVGQDQELKANEARTIENWDADSLGGMVRSKGFTSIATPLGGVDTYTKLMLHMNGADASTTFTDSSSSPHTVTASGAAQVDTAQSKFDGASALFVSATTDYLSSAGSTDWAWGTGDFTIDFWLRLSSTVGTQVLFDNRPAATDGAYSTIYVDTGVIYYYANTANRITGATLSTNTWYHVEVARSGTSTKLFINGTQSGSTYTDSTTYTQNRLYIGADSKGGGTNGLNGWIDELRVSKGIARHTTTFTVNSSAYDNYTLAPDGVLHHYEGTSTRNYVIDAGDLLYISGSTLVRSDASAFTSGVLTGGLSAGNKAFFTNSTDNVKYTTIAGSIAAPSTTPTNARERLYFHNSRLVAEGGGVTVYGSKAGSGNWVGAGGWTTSGDAWSIDMPDLTQGAVPGFPSGPEITVFTKFSAYSLYNFPNVARREILQSHGCSAPYSIARGTEGVFFFSLYPTLGVWLWDGVNWINLTVNETWVSQVSLTNRCFGIYSENKYRFFYTDNTSGLSYPNVCRIYDARWGRWMNRVINTSVADTFGMPFLLTKANNELYVTSSQAARVYQLEDTSTSDNTYATQANYKTKDFTSRDFGLPRDEVRMKLLKATATYFGTTGTFSLQWTADRGLHSGSQTFDLSVTGGDLINTTFTMNSSYIVSASDLKDRTTTRSFNNSAVGRRFSFQLLNQGTGERVKIKKVKLVAIALEEA